MRVQDLQAIRIKLASPEEILSWSHGEVTKAETINYRSQRPEKDGLFCERIFGPEKDYHCYCGKYQRIRYKGVICDRCGVEVTKASVRRERMGHITLASPVSHIWFLRGVPSVMSQVLDIPMQQLERVIYFSSYIVLKVDEEAKKRVLEEIEKEYKVKAKSLGSKAAGMVNGQGSLVKDQKPKTKDQTGRQDQKPNTKLQELKAARDAARQEVLSLQPMRILTEGEYRTYSLKYGDIFEAGTGAETVRKLFEQVDLDKEIAKLKAQLEGLSDRKKVLGRLRILQAMKRAGIRPEWMFLTVLPVLPPDLRPMVQLGGGRYASSDLNDLYRRVINRNNRLKYLLEISAPEVIVRNEKRMLQEAVDALIDNGMRVGQTVTATTGGKRLLKSLADMLKGKQGRFRQNLLGKRVDYSGRSVIVVGPELKLNQCGIPKQMALELFRPMVIKKILDAELAFNVRGAGRLIEEQTPDVWAMLEEVVKDKYVLLNRAPTLHKLGIQAFQPVLIEGSAIRLHPLVCKAFNADFDGDQMAVHVPLSEEAQREAAERMASWKNLLKPATGTPIASPSQDIILGCYYLTTIKESAKGEGRVFGSIQEALMAYEYGEVDLRAKIKVRTSKFKVQSSEDFIETSVGRIIFNEALPDDYEFVNEQLNSKRLDKLVSAIFERYGIERSAEILDKIKDLGFEYATLSGVSWGMDDLVVPSEKPKLIAQAEKAVAEIDEYYRKGLLSSEEKKIKTIEIWQKTKGQIEKLVPESLPPGGSVFSIVDAGARGSWSQPVQMAGMKGLVINPAGQIIELPVKSSFKEGFDVLEYFISTHGARKGTADTALRTSTAGYLTRRLVDVAHEVVVSQEDCRDKDGLEVSVEDAKSIGQKLIFKLVGRVAVQNVLDGKKIIVKQGEVIGWPEVEKIEAAGIPSVKIRSPLTCKARRGVCRVCYGWDLSSNKLVELGEAVGIVAAQAIGEPGTQLTMRTFHTGGVAGAVDITLGLPRVEEIFEARTPSGKAVIAEHDGKVVEITEDKIIKLKVKSEKLKVSAKNKKTKTSQDIVEYKIPGKAAIWVKVGEEVKRGQQLCEGSVDLQELFRATGQEVVRRHIVREVQKIYVSQGASIHDKHIEVIVRQMFSRARVRDAGDSGFIPGQILEHALILDENEKLLKEKKKPITAVPVLFGISRVSLTTDSFLSAASFQETSRVLIRAAVEGREDQLRGLKENVIIGKLVPAGTGFRK